MGCMMVKQETYDRAQKNMLNLPSFCAVYQDETGPVDDATAKLVADTWATCMAGTAAPYLEAHRQTPSITPLVFFYNTYYGHLFEMAPEIRPLFTRSMVSQGRMLANMIKSVVVNISQDYNLFRLSLEAMARNHNKMGIKAEYYALSGLCLFTTIRVCLGEKLYNEEIRIAWTRLYARMMQIIIPVTVSNAMPGSESKEDYFMKVIKVQNHEGEREAKQSVSRTPPSGDKAGSNLLNEPVSVTAGMEEQLAGLGDTLAMDLKRRLQAHVPSLIADRTYKGVEYKQVMIGSELVDWLIVNKQSDTRENAVRMASQLWALGLRHVHEHDSLLDDYSFYYWMPEQPTPAETMGPQEASELKHLIMNESRLIDTRTYKLETYVNSLVASSLVDWLVSTGRAADRMAAVHIGRQLRHIGLHSCHGHAPFDDTFALFTFEMQARAPSKSSSLGLQGYKDAKGNQSANGSHSPSPGTPTNQTVTLGGIQTSTIQSPQPASGATSQRVLGTGHAFMVGGSSGGSVGGSPPASPMVHTGIATPAGGFAHGGGGNHNSASVAPAPSTVTVTTSNGHGHGAVVNGGTASGHALEMVGSSTSSSQLSRVGSPVHLPGVILATSAAPGVTPLVS